jgi:hypothetical protein
MASSLSPPPVDGSTSPTWTRWFQQLWDTIRGSSDLSVDLGTVANTNGVQTLKNKTLTQSAWTALTLNSPWSDFGSTFRPAISYRKDSCGNLWVSGFIKTSADPGAFDVFATLPTGFRPAYDQHAPLMRANWGGADKNVALKVLQNGDLVLNEAAPAVAVTYLAINFVVPLD